MRLKNVHRFLTGILVRPSQIRWNNPIRRNLYNNSSVLVNLCRTKIFSGFSSHLLALHSPLTNGKENSSRYYSTVKFAFEPISLDSATYEKICSETLESLCDYFEELVEQSDHLKAADVSFGDGVLSVNLGKEYGTYVINRQTPNKQIWLSSPVTGPKRYDYVGKDTSKGTWIYKHTGETLHELLQKEIKAVMKKDIDFFKLPFSKI